MKTIILLENKVSRKDKYNIGFSKHKNLESIFGDEKCNEVLSDFLKDNTLFDQYDTIFIHSSIFHEDERPVLFRTLKEYCIKNKKTLVKFSGGGDIGSLNNNTLELTAKSFYENVEIFLYEYEKNTADLLMLGYGKSWDLNILLNILEKINILIEDNNGEFKEDFDEFEDEFDLPKLKKIFGINIYERILENVKIDEDEINLDQIKTIYNNLKRLIQDKVNV